MLQLLVSSPTRSAVARPWSRLGLFGSTALVLLGLLGLVGCFGDKLAQDYGTRAVVIGIDGADWKIIDQLAQEGGMPNLMALKKRAAWGEIETLTDIALSPVIWTSVATGKTAAKHGITWFMVDKPDGTRVPVRSSNRKVKAIWNILGEHKRRPAVLGWWATYPAEEVGRGLIVSDALGFHGFGATARNADNAKKTYPSDFYKEVDPLVPPEQQVSAEFARRFIHISPTEYRETMFDPARYPERNPFNPIHLFQQYAVTAQGYTAIAKKILRTKPYDLFMMYYEQGDSFSHLFIKYAPPKLDWIDEEEFERYRDVVFEWYRYQDEMLGEILAEIDLKTTAVFILSDHGFKSGDRRIRSEDTVDIARAHLDHETHGIFLAAGPHIKSGSEVKGAAVMDLTPTVLHYLGFPVAKDMDGRVLESVFEPAFLEKHPIRYIQTFEDETKKKKKVEDEDFDAEQSEENLKALRALGYIGGAAGDGEDGDEDGESSPELHNNMGRIHLRDGKLDEARREFRRALALDANNADSMLNLATVEASEGRTAAAEQLIRKALQANPDSVAALSQLAELRRDQGDLTESIRLFSVALSIDDSLPFLHMGYGDVLQRAGRFDEAVKAFKLVLQLEPDSFKARYNLGVTYANQGKIDQAIATYEEALEKAPKDPEGSKALNNLGAIRLERGDTAKAKSYFERAVALAPGSLEGQYNLGLILLGEGKVDDALKHLEAAAALAPDHQQVNARLGLAYLQAGRGQDAYRSFVLVRRLYPDDWVAPMGLAVLHAAQEDRDKAKELLDESIRLGGKAAREAAGGYTALTGLR